MQPAIRQPEEIVESTRYGKLYLVHRIHGRRLVALRARRGSHDRDLIVNTNEKKVFDMNSFDMNSFDKVPIQRDLIFIDSEGHMALWIKHGEERQDANRMRSTGNSDTTSWCSTTGTILDQNRKTNK